MASTFRKRVLLLDGHTRQVLPMAEALRRDGYEVGVVCRSRWDMGYVSRWPHSRWLGPDPKTDPEGLVRFVGDLLVQEPFDVVVPLFDHAAEAFSRAKTELTQQARIAINDHSVFLRARNKLQTMRDCAAFGVPSPITILNENADADRIEKELTYPMVIKPCKGDSAVGFAVANDRQALEEIRRRTTAKHGPVLVQEYIPQTDLQYKAEIFVGDDGAMKAAVVFSKIRWYPVDGGSSTMNVTVSRPDIIENCMRLLRGIGWRGYADVDLIQDPRDGVAKVMEINPRITGSVKIAFAAGVDFADMVVRHALGEDVRPALEYKVGQYLRYFFKDILWFWDAPDRWRAKPNWFAFFSRNCTDQVLSLRDPLPGTVCAIQSFCELIRRRHT
jgi:predicted ATP-grasp superfamily ATP-dependent carboligase